MKRFDGKTAWWLWFLFLIYNLIPIGIIVFDKSFVWNAGTIVGFIVCYLVNIIWLPALIRDWVDVYDDYMVFYYGFISITIKIADIVSVEKSHNPISATANSLDRVRVMTKRKGFYLSLYKNNEFIELINSKINSSSQTTKNEK